MPVLVGAAKWKFTYDGRAISANVHDETFMGRVQSRAERFAAGDRLEVDLEIGESWNAAIADYEQTGRFAVIKVYRHTQPPSGPPQMEMFPEDDA